MRKNKTFEVNILSEQSSYVQTENASFYTSDTEAFLNFKPADADFNFTSATIALLNRDDSSLVSVDVTAVEGVAEYEMTPEVIAHFGNWVAQVVFKNDNESYTSGLISFDVNRYLMDERPPRLEDVTNWKDLYENATETIQELNRISDDLNATKQILEQSETQRATAESDRASAEAQRKIDHANRSAELAGKADKKQEDWLYPTITNGTADSASPPKFFKDEFGVVHLSGRINDLVGNRLTLFTLPPGYRPYVHEGYPVVTGGGSFGFGSIPNSGPFYLTTGNIAYVLLNGITFKAER